MIQRYFKTVTKIKFQLFFITPNDNITVGQAFCRDLNFTYDNHQLND